MSRLHANFKTGTLSASVTNVATTMSSAAFAGLPVVAAPDYLMLILDPLGVGGNPEIVKVTAHSSSSTTVTVVRGRDSTTARSHLIATVWRHGPIASDFANRALSIVDFVVGDGTTDDSAAYQQALDFAAAIGVGLYHPGGVTTYIPTPLTLPDNTRWYGDGSASVLLSDVTGTFSFANNEGFAGATSNANIDVRGIRFRREADLDGTEGPYDGGLNFRKCNNVYVDDVIFDGGMTGVHFEGCINYGWGSIVGYRQGDITLRINTYTGGESAQSMRPGKAVSIEAGYQLLDGTALPNPAGPLGSGHLNTQDDAQLGDLIAVDCRFAGYEMGGLALNTSIRSYEGIVNTAGRNVSLLLADFKGIHIGPVTMRLNAAGIASVNADGDGAAQIQEDLRIDSVVGWDRSGSSTERILVNIGDDIVRASVGSVWSDGFKALVVGGSSTLAGTQDIDIGDVFCRNAPKAGASFSLGGSNRNYRVGRIHIVDSRGLDADPKQNSGVVFTGGSAGDISIGRLRSEDTRAGGARADAWGIYLSGAKIRVGELELVNNKTGDIATDSSGEIVTCHITGTGDPNSVHQASPGSTFTRENGGAGTSLYVKETGALPSNTGWVGK